MAQSLDVEVESAEDLRALLLPAPCEPLRSLELSSDYDSGGDLVAVLRARRVVSLEIHSGVELKLPVSGARAIADLPVSQLMLWEQAEADETDRDGVCVWPFSPVENVCALVALFPALISLHLDLSDCRGLHNHSVVWSSLCGLLQASGGPALESLTLRNVHFEVPFAAKQLALTIRQRLIHSLTELSIMQEGSSFLDGPRPHSSRRRCLPRRYSGH
jgi:hypothetical protein